MAYRTARVHSQTCPTSSCRGNHQCASGGLWPSASWAERGEWRRGEVFGHSTSGSSSPCSIGAADPFLGDRHGRTASSWKTEAKMGDQAGAPSWGIPWDYAVDLMLSCHFHSRSLEYTSHQNPTVRKPNTFCNTATYMDPICKCRLWWNLLAIGVCFSLNTSHENDNWD